MTQVIKYKYKLVWVQTKRKKRTHLCSPRKIKIKSTKKECSLFLKLLINSKTYQSANDGLLKLPLCTLQVLLCQRFCSYFSNHVLVALVGRGRAPLPHLPTYLEIEHQRTDFNFFLTPYLQNLIHPCDFNHHLVIASPNSQTVICPPQVLQVNF